MHLEIYENRKNIVSNITPGNQRLRKISFSPNNLAKVGAL